MKMYIPMSSPEITEKDVLSVVSVLQSSCLSIGPKIEDFEKSVADFIDAGYAAGVSSGTAGLHLSLVAVGIKENDIVITSPFSFVASANSILYERGIPIFVDVDEKTGNLKPELIELVLEQFEDDKGSKKAGFLFSQKIRHYSSTPQKIKAVLPVHVFGQPADMDPILEIAKNNNLRVIEDACEALGSEYKGKKAGSLGDSGVFGFYPNKQITAGEGGMIVTNRRDWDRLFRSLRNQGRDEFNSWLNHDRLGYNYRLDETSAALGASQMERIDDILFRREQVAEWYNERLRDVEFIETPYIHPNTTRMSWFVYVVKILPPAQRDQVKIDLEESGIPSRVYFSPIHLQSFYREKFGYIEGDFPVTEKLGKISLALPFSSVMTEEQVDFICDRLRKTIEPQMMRKELNNEKILTVKDAK